MIYSELIEKIEKIGWFKNVGQFEGNADILSISSLAAWDSACFKAEVSKDDAYIASNMDWLPTTRDQSCSIGDVNLDDLLSSVEDGKRMVMKAYKTALKSLRGVDLSKFKSGPNDFSESAKGAALYCVRMAAKESLVDMPGFWTNLFQLYCDGYWPCGVIKSNKIVVY